MTKHLFFTLLVIAIMFFGISMAPGQFNIKIPKIPDTKKTAAPPTTSENGNTKSETADKGKAPTATMENPARDNDQPSIAKDSVNIRAFTFNVYKKNYDIWSWVPEMNFRVNGPVASGSQLYAEFTLPGGGQWLKFDCQTGETQPGRWWKTECGGHDIPEDRGILNTGAANFAIKLRNELAGSDATLFTGRIKVAKALSNEYGPKAANHFVYYIDQDWNLPIGYVFLTQDDVRGWNMPGFNIAFWVRGEATNIQPHLFYQGKEVGKINIGGEESGRAGCGSITEINTTHYVNDSMPQKAKWARVECSFPNIKGWDKTGETREPFPGQTGSIHMLASNPGEYEVKVLWNNHLARSIKFTVGRDGKITDNGMARNNKLGSDRYIVPVQIIGDQDGQWGKEAWKTEAFYGNPLTGFTAQP